MKNFGKILLYFCNSVVALFALYGMFAVVWNYVNEFVLYGSGISVFSDGNLYLLIGGMICLGASISYIFLLSRDKYYLLSFLTLLLIFFAYTYAEYEDDSMSGLIVVYSAVPYIIVAYILLLVHYSHKRK